MSGIFIKYKNDYCNGIQFVRDVFISGSALNEIHADINGNAESEQIIGRYRDDVRTTQVFNEICACIRRGQNYYEMPEE